MLQTIHDKSKGILGIVIVILIGATFALWGIGDYLGGATEKAAAKVDDMEISQGEYEQALARQRQNMEQRFGGQLPESPLFEQQMKEQVIEQLISQRVLLKMAEEQGYRIADPILAQRIRNMEAFQQDGVFMQDNYQAIVESTGMAVKEFENRFRQDLKIQQLQDGLSASAFLGKIELELINRLQRQQRDFAYLSFSAADYMNGAEVTEAEIEEAYEANRGRYMHPESMSVSYVELTAESMAKEVDVDEEAVRRMYDDYVSSLAGREQRKASHILIAASSTDNDELQNKQAKAESLLTRIQSGENFADLAKELSDDPGSASRGGDLGWVSRGMMVPEFEKALFALAKGAVSGVVKSSYGFHVIRLDDIKAEAIDSFETKRAELETQYRAQIIEDRFYEQSELMATTAYENDGSLQPVADALGLSVKTSPQFNRQAGTGIAMNEKVRKAAFDAAVKTDGRNSDIIEVAKQHAVVLRVNTHTPAKQKTLDEVKNLVASTLRAEKARAAAESAAADALKRLEAGESLVDVAKATDGKLTDAGKIDRSNQATDPQILSAVFSMSKPASGKAGYRQIETAMGSAVIALRAVESNAQASAEDLAILSGQFAGQQANLEMSALVDYLKSQADINRNNEL